MIADHPAKFRVAALIDQGKLVVGDGYRAKNIELSADGLPFARAGNINQGFRFDDADHLAWENVPKAGSKVSQPGDVVFTSKGTVGRFAYVRDTTPRFVYSPQLCYWRSLDDDLIDSRFLYYWMHGQEFSLQFNGVKGQTDMADYVSLGDQRRMHISVPDVDEQRAIAHILGTLDDKIELNQRMNETLEAIARALFQSWFVDFDPVRAKAAGQQPSGMDAETAALFPDSFKESALGEIPCGWSVEPIGDLVQVVGGSTPRTSEPAFWDGGTHHWATPRDLAALASPVLLDTDRKITDTGLQQISSGLLPSGTVLMSSRAPIGYLAIAEVPVAINQGFIAMVSENSLLTHYVFQWAKANMEVIKGRANGTTFMEVSKTSFRPIPALVPIGAVVGSFNRLVEPLHKRMVANLVESSTLAAARDELLPRLLSGQLKTVSLHSGYGDQS